MNPEITLTIGATADSTRRLALRGAHPMLRLERLALAAAQPRHAVRCAESAAISSGWQHCDAFDFGDPTFHHTIDVWALRCRGAELRGGAAYRAWRERS